MSHRRTGDLKLIQELNRSIILDAIRKSGPISRSKIAKLNKISPTTVTSAVNELIKEGLVYEGETGISSGGRKPILVHFRPDSRYIVAVSVTNSVIELGKLNLRPEVCEKQCFQVSSRKGEELLAYLVERIDAFINSLSDFDKCIGISIITPGIVDHRKGVIRYNSKLEWMDVPLKQIVENRCRIKTWLENDSNALALAEKEIGHYRDSENLLYVVIGEGVGAGIVLNGSIFRGLQGGAGELGHTIVERGGIRCECGNKGCLENYVSWPVVYSRIVSSLRNRKHTKMIEMADGNFSKITPSLFLKAAEEGDGLAEDILEDTASYLSTGLINIVNLFNPDFIILGGELVNQNEMLISKVNNIVAEQGLQSNISPLKIVASSLGADFELLSAANIVLHDQFKFTLCS